MGINKGTTQLLMIMLVSYFILWATNYISSEILSLVPSDYAEFYESQSQKEYLSQSEFEQLINKQDEYHQTTRQQGDESLSLIAVKLIMVVLLITNFIAFKGLQLKVPTLVFYLTYSVVSTAFVVSFSASVVLGISLAFVILLLLRRKQSFT
ncbi:hypothetical protein LP316_13295 [Thalassotalea sp. LPB0316]|uniref:hypothetical protein n=1 Tax=Thalassotalea sp. LPB0316 TaxID=2769490 RepID=UPI001868FF68|nr:hypothetical protein [Thalassotalea sp. LPB0316]QOL25259.1 hypothetical protein LP316_13295 [Thalassotalea sp. LPB0316]